MTDRPNDNARGGAAPQPAYDPPPRRRRPYERESIGEATAKSFIRSVAGRLGRAIVRVILRRSR
jgi:hypothetical protein